MPGWLSTFVITTILYAVVVNADPIQVLEVRQNSSDPNAILPGWSRVGCFVDQGGIRVLQAASFSSANMTPAACMTLCTPGNFAFAGVEFHKQCFCDYAMQKTISAPDSDCDDACTGDGSLTCGGMGTITVFANVAPVAIHPGNKPFVNTWKYKGCFSDLDDVEQAQAARDLERIIGLSGPASVETCTAACKAHNFVLAGLENGGECWCGNAMLGGVKVADSNCLVACSGDHTEFCGSSGSNNGEGHTQITIYEDTSVPPVNLQTCLTSQIVGTILLRPFFQNGSSINALLSDISDSTFPPGFTILSACDTCVEHMNLGFGIPGVLNGQRSNSFIVNVGDSPTLIGGIPNITFFNGYCWMPNPINPIGPLFQPLLLGVNSRADLWALCPNITASGRLDLVFSPIDGHPHYLKSDCEAIFIETDIDTGVAIVSSP
ncbi:WSC-domain-containing protein [Phlegmacium glaucopus]|nr:WSC-domain-containing protein [Phlegmacium glaucopus]